MLKKAFNLPLNSTSLGQVSILILRELFERGDQIHLFPIGNIDLSSQEENKNFISWVESSIKSALSDYKRDTPIFKLWHITGSLESFSKKQVLFSFYEVDQPTNVEKNIIDNNSLLLLSSTFAVNTMLDNNVKNVKYLPLAFDKFNFKKVTPKQKNGIQFGLFGKLEPSRKRHLKTLSLWAQKYGNNPDYVLNCAIFNPFIDPKQQSATISSWLGNKNYFNISFLAFMQKNSAYNDYLNSGDIVIGMSGAEGWGLPEFHSVALGKHSIMLNEHSYKEWANKENSVLVKSSGKINAEDGLFFHPNQPFNQGNIFDFNEMKNIMIMTIEI
jgi:hypothetical protein